jgi:hypothetical protein
MQMSIVKRATRVREDHIGDALRAAVAKPRNWSRNDREYINEYSRANGLLWHLGHAEHKSALAQLHARMRVYIPRDESILQAEVTAGEFVALNGVKIFSEFKGPWNKGMETRPTPPGAFVDGMSHPAIITLITTAKAVGDTAILTVNPKTGKSEIMDIARMNIKERGLMIANKVRDYGTIQIKEAEKEELVVELRSANARIDSLEAKQLTFDDRMNEKFAAWRAEMMTEMTAEAA